MKNGVPLHAALGIPKERADALQLDVVERRAFAINFSILAGAQFDWDAMRFKEPNA